MPKEEQEKKAKSLKEKEPRSFILEAKSVISKFVQHAKNGIKDFIDDNTLKLLEKKQQAIDGLGFAIGESLGKAVVTTTKKLCKNNLDKVREKLNNIVIKAKAKIGKTRMNLMAKIGV